jgi:hypothetical protein
MELSVYLQGRKDNICDIAVKHLDAGVGWLLNFNNEINMISNACAKMVLTPAFDAIDMVHHEPPGGSSSAQEDVVPDGPM